MPKNALRPQSPSRCGRPCPHCLTSPSCTLCPTQRKTPYSRTLRRLQPPAAVRGSGMPEGTRSASSVSSGLQRSAARSRRRADESSPCCSRSTMLEPGTRGSGLHVKALPAPGRATRDRIPQIKGWFTHIALHAYHAQGAVSSSAVLPSAVPVQNGLEHVGRGVLSSAPRCQHRQEHSAAKPQQTCLGRSVLAGAAPAARAVGVRPGLTAGTAPAAP